MSLDSKAPKTIWNEHNVHFSLLGFFKKSPTNIILQYQSLYDGKIINLTPEQIERLYFRDKPLSNQNIIQQGKYECAPAALAMALNESLFMVKRHMAKFNWRNDDAGVNDELLRNTARSMGRDLIEFDISSLSSSPSPCLLMVKSLNVEGYTHAVTWNGQELLDPNTNYPGRYYWGTDWSPDMIGANTYFSLLDKPLSQTDNQQYIDFIKEKDEVKKEQIKAAIIKMLSN